MKYFPIFLDANKINAIIIGGGDVAARKIELLLKSTHCITVMSADVNESVMRLIKTEKLHWLAHDYKHGLLSPHNLVIAATNDQSINQQIATEAKALSLLINVVDQPALCSYITPAIIDRNPMLIAISSSGSAPVLVRMLREQIEKILPHGYGRLAQFCFKFRDHVKARVKGLRNRRLFWEKTLNGNIGQAILQGNNINAEQQFIASLKHQTPPPVGEITFIHTQSGDPDALTLQAHREMQFADAVFYDQQVNIELLEYVRRDADKYPQSIDATLSINYQHAIELAEKGLKVIYLLHGNEPLPDNAALLASNIQQKEHISGS